MDPSTTYWLTIAAAIVFWLICGSAGTYVSMQKCRPPQEGFFFAMLFGPLGIIAAACMPTLENAAEEEEEDENVGERIEELLKRASGK
jgi:hypothetical protein